MLGETGELVVLVELCWLAAPADWLGNTAWCAGLPWLPGPWPWLAAIAGTVARMTRLPAKGAISLRFNRCTSILRVLQGLQQLIQLGEFGL